MPTWLLLNGPNLNMLGQRDRSQYGSETLPEIEAMVQSIAEANGITLAKCQSNHEGVLIDWLQQGQQYDGIIFNPGGYSHTSIAIRDAIASIDTPVIEVHLSNIHNRESFRHHSYVSAVASGQIVGLGALSYKLAAYALLEKM
ncbi:3-dehydroquinate dehydratase-2 [Alkalibacillus flavidus]|uniref:3-dehydroquinate dehydratase n=1 Tax=Alkalibacillus flavidus TaxID=546021 RepID=A0ABV2KXI2_9BACI